MASISQWAHVKTSTEEEGLSLCYVQIRLKAINTCTQDQ